VDPVLLIFIGIGVLFIIAESVNEYQKNPPPEGGLGALILGGVMGMAIGAGTILVPAYVGEWFFGIGGWFVGFVFGIIAWLKLNSYLTGVADGSIEYDLEARIIAYRKGQIPLTFSNTTMALVLYGGLFYLGISQFPGTGILPAAVGGFLGLIIARLIVFKFNKTVLGWMEAEAAKKAEETGEETDLIVRETPSETNVYPTPPIRKSVGNREFIKQLPNRLGGIIIGLILYVNAEFMGDLVPNTYGNFVNQNMELVAAILIGLSLLRLGIDWYLTTTEEEAQSKESE